MTASGPVTNRQAAANNLPLVFQEAIVVILRTRYGSQQARDTEGFRASIRELISQSVKRCREMGYSDEILKMALYAIVGFLDESILSSRDAVFADWAKRPLQEEMFGGHIAGEVFFRNVTDLLNRPASAEVADVLELHAHCLLLGYRGKFAIGDASEVYMILRRIRDKVASIRGADSLFSPIEAPAAILVSRKDQWVRRLSIALAVAGILSVALYLGYTLLLDHSIKMAAQVAGIFLPHPAGVLESVLREWLA